MDPFVKREGGECQSRDNVTIVNQKEWNHYSPSSRMMSVLPADGRLGRRKKPRTFLVSPLPPVQSHVAMPAQKVERQARRKREKKRRREQSSSIFTNTPLFRSASNFFFHSPSPHPTATPTNAVLPRSDNENSPGFFLNNSAGPFSRHFVCKAFIEKSTMRQLKKKAAAAPRSRTSQVGFFPF